MKRRDPVAGAGAFARRTVSLGLVTALGCREAATQLVVQVDLDPRAPPAVTGVEVTARMEGDGSQFSQPTRAINLLDGGYRFPGRVLIAPLGATDMRRVILTVTATVAPGGERITQEFVTRFERGRTQVIYFRLSALCARVECGDGRTCVPTPTGVACAERERPLVAEFGAGTPDALTWADAAAVADVASEAADVAFDADAADATGADVVADAATDADGAPGPVDVAPRDVDGDDVGDAMPGACDDVSCDGGRICVAGTCACPPGMSSDCGGLCAVCTAGLAAPRPIAPLPSAVTTSRRPTLRWMPATGGAEARVELCRDRTCAIRLETLDTTGSTARPERDLPPGVVFWRLRGRSGSNVGAEPGPSRSFTVPTRSAPDRDTSRGTASTDLNGDGFSDVMVASIGPPPGFTCRGSIFLGRSSALSATLDPEARPLEGVCQGALGDVNGDGRADVVGSNVYDGRGSLLVFLTEASGSPASTPSILIGATASAGLGSDVTLGDVNGDGFADAFVGANGESRAYLFLGGGGGLTATPAATLNAVEGGDFASAAEVIGDVNGDGFVDVAVGAPTAAGTGRVYVYYGASGGLVSTSPSTVLEPTAASEVAFGHRIAGGDVDRDGYADIVVSGWQFNRCGQSVEVFFGGSAGPTMRSAVQLRDPTGCESGMSSWFGRNLQVADVNGDGHADAVVSAPRSSVAPRGQVLIYLGRMDGTRIESTPSLPRILQPGSPGTTFGESLSRVMDFDGDGLSDIVVAAPRPDVARAFLFTGSRLVGGDGAPATTLVRSGDPDFGFYISLWGPSRRAPHRQVDAHGVSLGLSSGYPYDVFRCVLPG